MGVWALQSRLRLSARAVVTKQMLPPALQARHRTGLTHTYTHRKKHRPVLIEFKLASSPTGLSLWGCWRGSRVSRGWERCLDDELKSSHAITNPPLEKSTLIWCAKGVLTENFSIWGKVGDHFYFYSLSFETTELATTITYKDHFLKMYYCGQVSNVFYLTWFNSVCCKKNCLFAPHRQPVPDPHRAYRGRQISL